MQTYSESLSSQKLWCEPHLRDAVIFIWLLQVVVTTYQTLNQDFNIPKDIDTAEEAEWLADNGYEVLQRMRIFIHLLSAGSLQGSNSFGPSRMKLSSFAIGTCILWMESKCLQFCSALLAQALLLRILKLSIGGCLQAHLLPIHCELCFSTIYLTLRAFLVSADIYGLLRFGRFRPWNDWNDFNEHVVRINRRTPRVLNSKVFVEGQSSSWWRPSCR